MSSENHSAECKEAVVNQLMNLLENSDKTYDVARIRDAMDLAIEAHNGQRRRWRRLCSMTWWRIRILS